MNAIDILFDKGSVEFPGLVIDKVLPIIGKLVKNNNDWLLAAYIFECRKTDGFHKDTTSVYIVERDAICRPICHRASSKAYNVVRSVDSPIYHGLREMEVCPMLEKEYQELHQMGLI